MAINTIDELAVLLTARIDEFEKNISKAGRDIQQFGQKTQTTNKTVEGSFLATATAVGVLTAGLTTLIKVSASGAARVEQLERALATSAKNAGMAQEQVDAYVKSLEALSMSHKEALETVTMLNRMGYQQADGLRLVQAAQDMAAASGRNWEETLQDVMHAVNAQRPSMLRMYGITNDLDMIFAQFGETIGKSGNQLTFLEKRQAILNEIFKSAEKNAGAFKAQMQTTIGVMDNYHDELKNVTDEFGKAFLPILNSLMTRGTQVLKWFQSLPPATKSVITGISATAASVGLAVTALGSLAKALALAGTALKALQVAMLANPFTTMVAAVTLAIPALDTLLGRMDKAIDKSNKLRGEEATASGYSFRQIQAMDPQRRYTMAQARLRWVRNAQRQRGLTETSKARLASEETMLRDVMNTWQKDAASAGTQAEQIGAQTGKAYGSAVVEAAAPELNKMEELFAHTMSSGLTQVIMGAQAMKDVWRSMLESMLQMVLESGIKEALAGLFVGGGAGPIGGLFRGIGKLFGFDNPYHDAMARAAGGKWFSDAMRNFSDGYISSALSPTGRAAMAGAMGGGGSIVLNYTSNAVVSRGTPAERRRAADDMAEVLRRVNR